MFTRKIVTQLSVLGFLFSCVSFGQQKPATPLAPRAQELPVVMQQSVSAGKTAIGTKVRAKLEVATLVQGKVLPRNATLTGEVVESAAKTATTPSRLAIRMDSVQWKDGTADLKVYLTAWYYPATQEGGQDLQYGPPESPGKKWNGQGAYPNPNTPAYKPFPGADQDEDKSSVPDTAATKVSDHRVVIKDVEWVRAEDGTPALVSKRVNIKLDRLTTYVFAASDALPAK
jgi:hypothetical protein